MATANPFDLLGDVDSDDPSLLIAAAQQQKVPAKKAAPAASPLAAAKMPSKPLPPSESVREARNNAPSARGGFGRGGPGRGRGGRGFAPSQNRDFGNGNANGYAGGYGGGVEDGDAGKTSEKERGSFGGPRQPYRGGRRGGFGNGEAGGDSDRPPRRVYERRSGTGRGYEMKREGAGRGNWGTATDEPPAQETEGTVNTEDRVAFPEKQSEKEDSSSAEASKDNKDGATNEAEEKEEDKEMTLDEYEKIKEEKRKALVAMKAEERKVEIDKELEIMQQLSLKKGNDDVFIKLGSDKDKRKENVERSKKSLTINEFLKPAQGERYYSPGGRGRGRGRGGDRGPYRNDFGSVGMNTPVAAPAIEDPGQFPTLGGK